MVRSSDPVGGRQDPRPFRAQPRRLMDFNPTSESEVQGLHTALGAVFVLLPTAVLAHHPSFMWGHPQLAGSFIGFVYAAVKEFSFDEYLEDAVTRGSNWVDFSFYCVGILSANIILFL